MKICDSCGNTTNREALWENGFMVMRCHECETKRKPSEARKVFESRHAAWLKNNPYQVAAITNGQPLVGFETALSAQGSLISKAWVEADRCFSMGVAAERAGSADLRELTMWDVLKFAQTLLDEGKAGCLNDHKLEVERHRDGWKVWDDRDSVERAKGSLFEILSKGKREGWWTP